jgi:hypothetical protein
VTDLPRRVKTWGGGLLIAGAITTAALAWADNRWNQSGDIGEIRNNVEFLTALAVRDRLPRLDGRIQMLEAIPDQSRDDRQTLYELRLERRQLQRRLDEMGERGP